jgi:hypothetical protein
MASNIDDLLRGLDDMSGADDFAGFDDMSGADDYTGAIVRRKAKVPRALARIKASMEAPGVAAPGSRLVPIGLGTLTFSASSGTSLSFTSNPQKPILIRKLTIGVARNGTSAANQNITLDALNVGPTNQLPSDQATPVSLFDPQANGNNVYLDASQPGVTVSGRISVSAAPTATDTIIVTIGGIAETLS